MKKLFIFLLFPIAAFAEKYCDNIYGSNIKDSYRITYDGNYNFDLFQFCQAEANDKFFLILEHHPRGSLIQMKSLIDSNQQFSDETLINKVEQGDYFEWVISLTKQEFLFVTKEFQKLDANKSTDIVGPPDYTSWCFFKSTKNYPRCFWMEEPSEASKFKELTNLKSFVESKFPKALSTE